MHSSPTERTQRSNDEIVAAARRLCGADVLAAMRCGGGGNNQVYRVQTQRRTYALKFYGPAEPDRDRLAQEFDGLRFLQDRGIGQLPAAIAVDRSGRFALYEWINGTVASEHGLADIRAVLDLLAALHGAREAPAASAIAPATEAVLRLADLKEQIARRVDRLRAVDSAEPELGAFLRFELRPELKRRVASLRDWDLDNPLGPEAQTLSASDFGFHNALRQADGSLAFVDFEYFGWDDPVKLSADFLWHPGMRLSESERAAFLSGVLGLYGNAHGFRQRLDVCFPLYGLRWILIILNEFLPQVWARRQFSGRAGNWDVAKREQLGKARTTLVSVQRYGEGQFT